MDTLDLVSDLNAQDDDGLGWSTLADAIAPDRVRQGAMLLAGNSQARAAEGDAALVAVDRQLAAVRGSSPGVTTQGRAFANRVTLF